MRAFPETGLKFIKIVHTLGTDALREPLKLKYRFSVSDIFTSVCNSPYCDIYDISIQKYFGST